MLTQRLPGDRSFVTDCTSDRIELLLFGHAMPEPEDDGVAKVRLAFTRGELTELLARMDREPSNT